MKYIGILKLEKFSSNDLNNRSSKMLLKCSEILSSKNSTQIPWILEAFKKWRWNILNFRNSKYPNKIFWFFRSQLKYFDIFMFEKWIWKFFKFQVWKIQLKCFNFSELKKSTQMFWKSGTRKIKPEYFDISKIENYKCLEISILEKMLIKNLDFSNLEKSNSNFLIFLSSKS